jgi:hypothetical protein
MSAKNLPGIIAFGILTGVATAVAVTNAVLALVWGSIIMAGLAVIVAGFAILGGFEAWTLTGAAPPITWRERWAHRRHPLLWALWALLIGLGEGLLAGHFWWSACPPPMP